MMIRKGDTVYVRSGSGKGKTGRVLRVDSKKGMILVEGINMRSRHQRPTQKNPKGGVLTIEMPIHISNVGLAVQAEGGSRPSRVKMKTVDEGGKKVKVRVSVLTGEQI